ncbi:MAG: LysM peptidoglycan-binding domain-containing protein [Lacunisphaera sp.]
MPFMRSSFLRYGGLWVVLTTAVWAQSNDPRQDLYNLREDLRILTQRVGELSLNVEQLTRDNSTLQTKSNQSFVTIEQLNKAVAEINRTMQSALADQKRETLNQVSGQIERLAKQTQAAVDAVAKGQATRPAMQTNFKEDFPKEGINYTVQSGDTLSVIVRKNNARLQDVINANKISDPTKIRVGQTLFIPQAK